MNLTSLSISEQATEWVNLVDHPILKMLLLAVSTFISEDLACILGGVLAANGQLAFPLAVIGCVLGIWIGDVAIYWLGRGVTSGVLKWEWARKLVTPEKIARGRRFFDRYGVFWIFLSRFMPGSRVVSYLAAGASKWSFTKFAITLFIAALIWVPLLCGLAYLAGDVVSTWLENYASYSWLILLGVVAFIFLLFKFIIPLFSWRGRRRLFGKWQRLTRWEYWPIYLVYPPVLIYLIYVACRYQCWCLFTSSNPAIESSGFVFDSKGDILDLLSTDLLQAQKLAAYIRLPLTENASRHALLENWMAETQLNYPIVLKPDEGERGQGVAIIRNTDQAKTYLQQCREEVIGQRFISGPEFGVYYLRFPDQAKGKIISLTQKHQQIITGDGESMLEDLILADDRGAAMFGYYKNKFAAQLSEIPAKGEKIAVAEIGTHSRGALFTDDRHLITPEMEHSIDVLSQSFDGFHIGRYDIRVSSITEFQSGNGIQVLELNGVTAEPAHIYHPGFPLIGAWKALLHQWQSAVECGRQNQTRGHSPMALKELYSVVRQHSKKQKFEADSIDDH